MAKLCFWSTSDPVRGRGPGGSLVVAIARSRHAGLRFGSAGRRRCAHRPPADRGDTLPTLVTAADPADPDLVDGTSVVVAPRVRDALVLVQGLARLLDDEPLRRKVAAGGAALMAGRSWEEIAATHRAVYSEVLRDQE